ncbi:MAG TPA: protein kinase [Albitalea sp.]|nr:protein kinase [Albitalea sp.]
MSDFGPSTQQFDATRDVLAPGTRVGGYRIVELLGQGRSGIVYLALDSSLQRQVAIKEYLPADLAARDDDLQIALKPGASAARYAQGLSAFLRQAKLLARLEHPALPRVHGFWEENRTAYMTMAYCEGRSLVAVLNGMQSPPDEAWLRALLAPLLGALGVLHAAQGHHGQIAAESILVQADGSPLLLGFGAPDDATGTGPSADLHALARVLHSAISGEAATSGAERGAAERFSSLVDAAPALQRLFPELRYSKAFLAGIDRMLSVKNKNRLGSVAEFQQWLDRAPDAGPTTSPAPLDTVRMPEMRAEERPFTDAPRDAAAPSGSRWGLWIAAACLALLGAGTWWWMQTQSAVPRVAATIDAPPAAVPAPPPVQAPASSAAEVVVVPAATEPAASAPSVPVVTSEVEPEPRKVAAKPAPAEPDNPRAMCGARTNFSLVYCMEKQCKRPQFAQHAQCEALKRGEVN